MRGHFDAATRTAWGVARGDLETVREAASELDHRTRNVPVDWFGKIDLMRSAARRLTEARTLQGASARVGTLAESCSYCHRSVTQGPELAATQQQMTDRSPESDHARSWYWLWLGLTLADDTAWSNGAAAAGTAPAHPGTEKQVERYALLGERAREVTTAEERAFVFRETLGTCARCHAVAGVRLSGELDVGAEIATAPGASGPPAE